MKEQHPENVGISQTVSGSLSTAKRKSLKKIDRLENDQVTSELKMLQEFKDSGAYSISQSADATDGYINVYLRLPLDKIDAAYDVISSILEFTDLQRVDGQCNPVLNHQEAPVRMSPGIWLQNLRQRKNLTKKQLAKKLGIKSHLVTEFEQESTSITVQMAKRLEQIFCVPHQLFLRLD